MQAATMPRADTERDHRQGTLSLFDDPLPEPGSELAKQFLRLLDQHRLWLTRARLAPYGLTARDCRKAREQSNGRIIFGQRGYRSAEYATAKEIRECLHTLRSQAGKMFEEARQVEHIMERKG